MEKKKSPKKHYIVFAGNEKICDTWATTPGRARSNAWWKFCKQGDKFKTVQRSIHDFDVVEAS